MLKALARVALLLGLLYSPAYADDFLKCTTASQPDLTVGELSDKRLRTISANVLTKANLRRSEFALCEHSGYVPVIIGTLHGSRYLSTVFLPIHMRAFSDTEAEGIIAHEIAHTALFGIGIGGLRREVATDARAAKWVGSETVALGLQRLLPEFERLPKPVRSGVLLELHYRIGILRKHAASQE